MLNFILDFQAESLTELDEVEGWAYLQCRYEERVVQGGQSLRRCHGLECGKMQHDANKARVVKSKQSTVKCSL